MTLSNGHKGTDRVYSTLFVNGRCVRFLLDCGSTMNLLPASISETITATQLRPARSTLRMFDKTKLKTLGMMSAMVRHLLTHAEHQLDFYVTQREDALLGIDACQRLKLLRIVEKNICAVHDATTPACTSPTPPLPPSRPMPASRRRPSLIVPPQTVSPSR